MAQTNKPGGANPPKTNAPAAPAVETKAPLTAAEVAVAEAAKAAKTAEKAAKFKLIAARRAVVILKTLGFLENCANKGSYEYTPEQVATIFNSIEAKVKDVKAAFSRTGGAKDKIEIIL